MVSTISAYISIKPFQNKIKYSEYVGIETRFIHLKEDTLEKDVIKEIDKLNKDKDVTGVILQSPVPKQIDYNKCIRCYCCHEMHDEN